MDEEFDLQNLQWNSPTKPKKDTDDLVMPQRPAEDKMKELFERWLAVQFGIKEKRRLSFNKENGYEDEFINTLWIGFNAGAMLKQ